MDLSQLSPREIDLAVVVLGSIATFLFVVAVDEGVRAIARALSRTVRRKPRGATPRAPGCRRD